MPLIMEKTDQGTQPIDSTRSRFTSKTILHNDEWHTFDEVAQQLVKAVRCTYSRGLALANVVHNTGSAIVYSGPKERCEAVAMILEDIGLRTSIDS